MQGVSSQVSKVEQTTINWMHNSSYEGKNCFSSKPKVFKNKQNSGS